MKLSSKAEKVYAKIPGNTAKMGELRKIAKQVGKDHELAMELWSTGAFAARLLAILTMDKKRLSQAATDQFVEDMQAHEPQERTQLMDWLMANHLVKDKTGTHLVESWENSPFALQRRAFWYHQARLRWTGQTPPPNTEDLLASIEAKIGDEEPEVQWAMNFTAGQIGIFQEEHRSRCISIGEKTGLYKDEIVSRGCTPNYLPEFISLQVGKLEK